MANRLAAKSRRNRKSPWKWVKSHRPVFLMQLIYWALVVIGFVVGAYFLFRWFLNPTEAQQPEEIDVTRMALTVAAGFGGLVALVVAYRKQRDAEEGRFVERFGAAAEQLGHTDVAVRMAGVYAMAGVADRTNNIEQRQQCVDVLCGYLRLPYDPNSIEDHQVLTIVRDPGGEGANPSREIHFQYRQNDREVRNTIVRIIVDHLRREDNQSWSKCSFDFTKVFFENANFSGARFDGNDTSFEGATFGGAFTSFVSVAFGTGRSSFAGAEFGANRTLFTGATFDGTSALFNLATFSAANTLFERVRFGGEMTSFERATFSGVSASFSGATFGAEATSFDGAKFEGKRTRFEGATFGGRETSFRGVWFGAQKTEFGSAMFGGSLTWFKGATFGGNLTFFSMATFLGEYTSFEEASFDAEITEFFRVIFAAKMTEFTNASFTGETIEFSQPRQWNPAPIFDWDDPDFGILKPDNVKPDDWPPKERTEPDSADS